MNYRLIAMDLDGTLLGADDQVSVRNKKAIRAAARQGLIITIATGRMFLTSIPFVRELELDNDWPLIAFHGALIKTTESRKIIYHRPLSNKLAISLIRDAEERGLLANVFIDDNLYVRETNKFSLYYRKLTGIEIDEVGDLSSYLKARGSDPTKITIISWEQTLEELEEHYKRQYRSAVNTMRSRPYFLELTHPGATKGQGLKLLSGSLGIKREEIIAFGDNYNDLDMINFAGMGVAMANAVPELKEGSDLVAAANTEDGVAKVLEKHVLA